MSEEFDPLAALDDMSKMLELAAGYRSKAVELGFTLEHAELLAVQFHEALIRRALEVLS